MSILLGAVADDFTGATDLVGMLANLNVELIEYSYKLVSFIFRSFINI